MSAYVSAKSPMAEARRPGRSRRCSCEASPKQVGELAAREHEDAERKRVAVEHPLELRDPDPEVALNRRQSDVHDRVVEHDHEEAERDGAERQPPAILRGEDPRLHASTSLE